MVSLPVAGALIALVPSTALQMVLLLGAGTIVAAALLARRGRVLDAAWVIVMELYLIGPAGSLLRAVGISLVLTPLAALAATPFVAAALWIRRTAREVLVLATPLLALWAFAALSLAWSPDPASGADKIVLSVFTGLGPALCILVLAGGGRRVSWGLVAGVAFCEALGLIAFGTASAAYPGRPTLFDANPIWSARGIFLGTLVATFAVLPRLARATAVPVMVVAGLLTVSLGPFLGLLAGGWAGVGEALHCRPGRSLPLVVGWVVLGLAIAAIAIMAVSGAIEPASPLLARVLDDPNATSRGTYLGASLDMFLRAPLIGAGAGGFAAGGLDAYPHNLVAEIGSELGLVGLIPLAAWLWLAVRGAAGSPLLVALVVGTCVYTLGSGSLASNAEFWMITAAAASRVPLVSAGRVPATVAAVASPVGP